MRILIAILALGAVLAASPAQAFIELPSIKNRLIQLALDQISSPGSFEITVEEIEDPEEGGTSLIGVKIRDNEGIWATAERLTFAWRPQALLGGELYITKLELVGLDVMRLPDEEAEPPTLKPQEPWSEGPFDWPRAPINVVIEDVRVENAHLAEGVLANSIRFDAHGHARDKGDVQEVALELTRTDEVDGRIDFLMHREFGGDQTLRLDLSAHEAPGGLVAAYAGLPPGTPASLELHADGTVDDWRLELDASAGDFLTAQGNATLDYTERLNVSADFAVRPGPEMGEDLRTVLGEEARLVAEIVEQPDGRIEVVSGELTSSALRLTASGALATGETGESDLEVSLVGESALAELAEGVDFERFGFDGTVTGPTGELAGTGTFSLTGLATASVDARNLTLEGRVAQTPEGATFDLAGTGEGLRLDQLGPDVIGTAQLEATGALAGNVLTLEQASLDAAALTASASGSYDLAAGTGSLSATLSAPRIAPVAAAYGVEAEGSVSASAEVELAAEQVEADLSAAVENFAMAGVEAARLQFDGTVTQAEERIAADFTAEAEGFDAGTAEATRLTLEGTVLQAGEELSFDLAGDSEGLRIEGLPPGTIGEARLALRGAMEGDTLRIAEARVESPVLTAESSGTVAMGAGDLSLDYSLEAPRLGPVASAMGVEAAGSLAASGRVAGTMTAPQVVGEATVSEAAFAGQSYGTVRIDHAVTLAPAPQGRLAVTMNGSWLGAARAETLFLLEGDELSLSDLDARALGLRLAGAAEVDLGGPLIEGRFDVSVPELAPLGRFAGVDLSGSLEGQVTLEAIEGGQNVTAALEASRLTIAGTELGEASLTLAAEDVLEAPELDLRLEAEDFVTAAGTARLDYAGPLNVTADFSVRPGPEMGQELRTVLGEEARLAVEIVERPDGRIEVVRGRLSSPALELTASGALATGETGESDLEVLLVGRSELADLVEGVAFEGFRFDGTVTGPTGELAGRGAFALSGLVTEAVEVGSLTLEGEVTQTPDGATFDLAGIGEGLRLDQVGPEVIGTARLAARGALAGDVLTLEHAALDSAALTAAASGRYDLADSTGALALELSVPEIAPVADAYGVEAEGTLAASADVELAAERIEAEFSAAVERFATEMAEAERLSLEGTVTQAGERLSFELTGAGEGLKVDEVPADLTREARLAVRGAMEGETLRLETARLESGVVTAAVSGRVGMAEGGTVALDYTLEVPRVGPLAAAAGVEAQGSLSASGRAGGTFGAPRLVGEAVLRDAAYGGRSYGTVRLEHDVALAPVPEGQLEVAVSDSWLGDARAETGFRLDGEALTLSSLEARIFGASLTGSAEVDLGGPLIDGTFDVSVPDLGPAARFAGTEISGAVSGQVTLVAEEGQQNVRATLEARRLEVAGVEVQAARIDLSAAEVFATPRLDVSLTAGGVATGGPELETVRATVVGPLGALEFAAEAAGTLGDEKPLEIGLAGRADASGEPIRVTLARAEVTAGDDTIVLERPLELIIGNGTVAVEGLALSLPGDGMVRGDAALRPAGYTGDLTIEGLDLAVLGDWTGQRIRAGRLDASAEFDTRPGSAGMTVSAKLRGVIFEGAEAVGRTLDVDLRADWDGAQHDAELEVRGDFGEPLRASLSVPLTPRYGALPTIPPGGELDGRFAWSGRIGNLWALVPAPGHILDGDANIDLTLGGTVEDPRVTGVAEVTDGQYQNLALGTILTGVRIETRLLEEGDLEVILRANDGASGTVEARMLVLLGEGPVALDLTANADSAVLVRRDDVTAAVSAEVAVEGSLNELDVTGEIRVKKAEVRLVNAMPPSVVTLDGIRIAGEPEPESDEAGESVINLFLSIVAEDDIFVRGRGLDSEWQMDLAVTGTAAQPVISGTVRKVRGQLSLLGRTFELERGRVVFDGGREIDPELDVYLQREDHGLRGGIVIEGTPSDPELSFTSTPALPEDEVMPRLLFGQSRQSLTGAQALQLAAGIATLTGTGGGGPIEALREAAGLDVLRVEGESIEDAAVTVGRNVGEDVFIGAKQGLGEQGTTSVTVEVEVFDNVTVDAEVGEQGSSSVGISLQKDF